MFMEMIALYDAKNRCSELCNQVVETGEACVVSRRGQPIVKIVRVEPESETASVWGTLKESRARLGDLDTDFIMPSRTKQQRPNPSE